MVTKNKTMKQTTWLSEITCPECGREFEASDVLPYNKRDDGDHEDAIECDECGCIFDCYLSVTYHFKTFSQIPVHDNQSL